MSEPEWILCRGFNEFLIPDNDALRALAEHGRVRPDDYLFSPRMDACFQAKTMSPLNAIFEQATARRLARMKRFLALAILSVTSFMSALFAVATLILSAA